MHQVSHGHESRPQHCVLKTTSFGLRSSHSAERCLARQADFNPKMKLSAKSNFPISCWLDAIGGPLQHSGIQCAASVSYFAQTRDSAPAMISLRECGSNRDR